MPEHVHLLVLPHEGLEVCDILSAVKEPTGRRAIEWVRLNRPSFLAAMAAYRSGRKESHRFWLPGSGYDRNLWTVREIHQKIACIHNNPVRRGLVEHPNQWPWSSYRAWEEGVDKPIPIDRESLPPLEV